MNIDAFWQIIDDANRKTNGFYDLASVITSQLVQLDPNEIVAFKQHQYDLEAQSYRWDLWAVAYIINGGCSDDGFDYFCAWLIANGRKRYETAISSPESIGQWADGKGDFEDMMYVANDAYKQKTNEDFPYDKLKVNKPDSPIGDDWEEEQLEAMYPDLWAKFT